MGENSVMGGRRRLASVALAVALAGAACGGGDPIEASGSAAAPTSTSGATATSASGDESGDAGIGHDVVEIHGRWRIDLLDESGSIARRTEFDNAFVGEDPLSRVLGRTAVPGEWSIRLGISGLQTEEDYPCLDGPVEFPCFITETDNNRPYTFPTLAVSVVNETVELRGSATMQRDGSIGSVGTNLLLCEPDVTPDVCATGAGTMITRSGFTTKDASSSSTDDFEIIPVSDGQQVQVTVVLTFS